MNTLKNMFHKVKINQNPKTGSKIGKAQVKIEPNYKIDRDTFDIKADPAKIEIDWYSEDSKKSKYIKNEFTNFVDDLLTDTDVENVVNVLNNNLDDLSNAKQLSVGIKNTLEGERIKKILRLYFSFDDLPEEEHLFTRAIVNTELQKIRDDAGPVRVVMVNMKDMISNKYYSQIIFVDLYHLFIPSKHNGKTADEAKEISYKQHEELDVCLSKHLK